MYWGNLLTTEQKSQWRENNLHNETILEFCRNISIKQISVGNKTYGPLNVIGFGQKNEKLEIGAYCSIAREVAFILGGEHDYLRLSTFPFLNKVYGQNEAITKGKIVVEDDVWIGFRATILSGITIGQGAVIAAGSTIARDIPPYAIADSTRIIKYRFDEDIIEKLLRFDLSSLKYDDFLNYEEFFIKHNFHQTFFESKLYLSHLKKG